MPIAIIESTVKEKIDAVHAVEKMGITVETLKRLSELPIVQRNQLLDVVEKMTIGKPQERKTRLVCISGEAKLQVGALTLPTEDDARTVIHQATDIFSNIDEYFRLGGLQNAQRTTRFSTPIKIYEAEVKNCKVTQLFKKFPMEFDMIYMQQHEITDYCFLHKTWIAAHTNGTFFLLKENGRLYVIRVRLMPPNKIFDKEYLDIYGKSADTDFYIPGHETVRIVIPCRKTAPIDMTKEYNRNNRILKKARAWNKRLLRMRTMLLIYWLLNERGVNYET